MCVRERSKEHAFCNKVKKEPNIFLSLKNLNKSFCGLGSLCPTQKRPNDKMNQKKIALLIGLSFFDRKGNLLYFT